MDALALDRVEIGGEGGDQRLAFARPHLGDAALVQHHAADQLHVEMALAEHALGRLAHGGEGRHQDVVEGLAGGELLAEGGGAVGELGVGKRLDLGLERVDGGDLRAIGLQPAVVGGAEDLFRDVTEHS